MQANVNEFEKIRTTTTTTTRTEKRHQQATTQAQLQHQSKTREYYSPTNKNGKPLRF